MSGRGQGQGQGKGQAGGGSGASGGSSGTASLNLSAVGFDGRSIWGRWQGGNSAKPFAFALFGGGVELQRCEVTYSPQSSGPFTAVLEPAMRLDPNVTYTVGVSEARGPEDFGTGVRVIVAPPVVATVDHDGGELVVNAAGAGPSGSSLVLTHFLDGQEQARASGGARGEVRLRPSAPLESSRRHEIRLHYETNNSVGPSSQPVQVVVDAPEVVSADVDAGRVVVRWRVPPASPATGGLISLSDGRLTREAIVAGLEGVVTRAGLNPAGQLDVRVRSVVGRSVGPASDPWALPSAEPVIETVTGRPSSSGIDVEVADLTEADALRIMLRSDGVIVGEAVTAVGGGFVPGPFDPTRAYRVAARALGPSGSGPIGADAGVMTAVPRIDSVATTDGGSGTVVSVTVSEPVDRPYEVGVGAALLADGVAIAHAEAAGRSLQLALTDPPPRGSAYAVTVQGHGDDGASLAGPVSDPVPIVVHAPEVIAASWDGEAVEVSWLPLVQDGLVGYTVSLQASDTSVPSVEVTTDGTQARLPLAAPATGVDYTATVVGRTTVSVGPAQQPLAVQTAARPSAWFVADAVGDVPGHVFRADHRRSPTSPTGRLSFFLPELFNGIPVAAPQVTGLKLAATGDAALPWELTVNTDNNAWQFGSEPVRAQARSDVADFYAQFEAALDAGGASVLLPGALRLIGQVLARGVPMTFAETMCYAYGLDAEHRAVDLSPGMRMVVRASAYQLVPPDGSVGTTLSGYVPAGTHVFDLVAGPGSGPSIDVDALAALVAPTTIDASRSHGNQGEDTGLGGALDLLQSAVRRPYLRLVYPSTMRASAAKGTIGVENQVAVVAADSWSALQLAGREVASTGQLGARGDAAATFFRGRAAITAEIRVLLDGAETWVPVGTTVRQLVERVTRSPLRGSALRAGDTADGVWMTRRLHGVATSLEGRSDGAEPVLFAGTPSASAGAADRFDLPLLHGDSIRTTGDS